jgi:hypothetical protein
MSRQKKGSENGEGEEERDNPGRSLYSDFHRKNEA